MHYGRCLVLICEPILLSVWRKRWSLAKRSILLKCTEVARLCEKQMEATEELQATMSAIRDEMARMRKVVNGQTTLTQIRPADMLGSTSGQIGFGRRVSNFCCRILTLRVAHESKKVLGLQIVRPQAHSPKFGRACFGQMFVADARTPPNKVCARQALCSLTARMFHVPL